MTRQPKRASQAWKTVVLTAGCLVAAGSVALGPRALAQSAQAGAPPSTPASADIFEKASIIPANVEPCFDILRKISPSPSSG